MSPGPAGQRKKTCYRSYSMSKSASKQRLTPPPSPIPFGNPICSRPIVTQSARDNGEDDEEGLDFNRYTRDGRMAGWDDEDSYCNNKMESIPVSYEIIAGHADHNRNRNHDEGGRRRGKEFAATSAQATHEPFGTPLTSRPVSRIERL